MTQSPSVDNERMTSRSSSVVPTDERGDTGIESPKFVSSHTIVDRLKVARTIHLAYVFAEEPFNRVLELIVDFGSAFAHDNQITVLGE